MIGETVSHYRIVDKIGAGGMGEVYRAHDPRLNRDVAIKILPEALSEQPDRLMRFERESRAAGALNHPNIMAVYDVGNHEGLPFIVTELLEGENLRQRIDGGDLTVRKAVRLAAQIADGLAAAHGRGIVHRDLKPENVFVTRDGHLKILDFGLAKLIDRVPPTGRTADVETAEMVTEAGTVVGTVSYMAPEQLQGKPTDHRSDIFSFGIILFEMLSGRRPFRGDSKAQIVASILRDEPSHLTDPQRPVPPAVERIVRQCLEKRPEDRFESAHDLAIALRAVSDSEVSTPAVMPDLVPKSRMRAVLVGLVALAVVALATWKVVTWSVGPALPDRIHIAVLPFEAVGGGPEQALIAAGLCQTVTDGLTLLEEQTHGAVWVIPPSKDESLEQVWRRDNVTIGVTGRLQLAEDRVRLELAALAADSGRSLRAATIEDRMNNLSCLQLDPILRIAEMLDVDVSTETQEAIRGLTTNVTGACSLYLRGRGHMLGQATPADLDAAVVDLERAIVEDPGYRAARVALAEAYRRKYLADRDPAWLEKGVSEAERAIEQGGRVFEVNVVLGDLYAAGGHEEEALEAYRRAARSAKGSATGYVRLGIAYLDRGRFDEAVDALQKSINLRPGYWRGHHILGYVFWLENAYDAATNQFRRVTELAPRNVKGYNNLGGLLYRLERRDEAIEVLERSLAVEPNAEAYSHLGTLHFEDARFGDAAEMFERAVELSPDDYLRVGNLAGAYYWGGEPERAKDTFRRAIALGEQRLASGVSDPYLAPTVAGYYGMVGETTRGHELLDKAVVADPQEAQLMATIAESYEDLGDRDRALEWIGRALAGGVSTDWIDRHPSLNRLTQDPRYRDVVAGIDQP
jgi:tetratricopeptide (TPR) repeat protein/TolB-like protein